MLDKFALNATVRGLEGEELEQAGVDMKTKNKSGFSLIEIMVAVIILVVLALGGAAVMYQTGGGIQRQQNKREALTVANAVMETYWNRAYASTTRNDGLSDVTGSGSTNVTVNGINLIASVEVTTTTDTASEPCIEITVDINHLGTTDDVIIKTRRYPFGIGRAAL